MPVYIIIISSIIIIILQQAIYLQSGICLNGSAGKGSADRL